MTFSKIGRLLMALVASAALGLGMTACGGGTIGYLWVLGTYYNQISGFKIDDYTGNLTAIAHSPFPSGGTTPVSIVVKPGGRYVYVINSGSGATGTPGTASFNSPGASIAEFSVGTGGILTFEQTFFSQGVNPVWATFDSSGNFLYVLDKYSPDYAKTGNGSITAFAVDSSTGRLTLVTNNAILTNGIAQTWFDVGSNPVMSRVGSGGCLFTLSANSIYPYLISTANGQLTVATTGSFVVPAPTGGVTPNFTSINTGTGSSAGAFTYLTDSANNFIYSLQAGSSACSLTQISGSQMANLPGATNLAGTSNPMYSLTSTNGKYLYVFNYNQAGSISTANSSISAFNINPLGQLQPVPDPTSNPYAVGSGPTCAVQDPTNQYLFTSNHFDNTITGKLVDQNHGFLANLTRGTVFPTTQTPTCMAVSGNI